ncbi:MAG TPA: DegT/DnrJ/EryC1/StrS family aminotransferase [Vicinamibacterales bacterium]|nr:DegT/DnrJ/EryC1/StrS family aminotransferase [Vicinamibacterales bacterium]
MIANTIPFVDLHPGEDATAVRDAMQRVVTRGWFILGPEVDAFESEFAHACGTAHAAGVGNGTDAIALLLRGLGIGTGDEVIVPAITAAYTALAVVAAGAVPVIADVDDRTLTLDPAACRAAITSRTKAIVPVHLYGQAAPLADLKELASRHALAIVEDCCQAHLATADGIPVGTTTQGGAFSFYPTKNLGAIGDGGAAIMNDAALARRIRQLRNGGQTDRYHHQVVGVNSRLDEVQAAVLRARLPLLPLWTARRRELAAVYRARLTHSVTTIAQRDPGHVYHLFPVRTANRDALQAHLKAHGIETLIHYPVPLNAQPAFAAWASPECPVAARAARELLSLPLHSRLSPADVERVADCVNAWTDAQAS